MRTGAAERDNFQPVVRAEIQARRGKFHRLLKEKVMNDTTAGRDYASGKEKITMQPDEGKRLTGH